MSHRTPFPNLLLVGVFAAMAVVFLAGKAMLTWRGEDHGRVTRAGYDVPADPAARDAETPAVRRIAGRLVLPLGTPEDPTLEVVAWNATQPSSSASLRTAVAPDGGFALDLPAAWPWYALTVSGRHLYLTVPHLVKDGEAPEEVELHPHLGGWVRGTVVAPEDFDVRTGGLEDGRVLATPIPTLPPGAAPPEHAAATPRLVDVGVDGSFELRGLPAGLPHAVRARTETLPRSDLHEIELGPGETRDVVLELRRDGSLTGKVYAADGLPAANRVVYLARGEEEETRHIRTDEAGEFRIGALPAGEWTVWTVPADVAPGAESDPHPKLAGLPTATVLLEGGIESHVVLGRETPPLIRLAGTVTSRDGTPVTGTLRMLARGQPVLEGEDEVTLDSEGRFAFLLDAPGPYLVSVEAEGPYGATGTRELLVDVPTTAEHALEIVLPAGGIEGVVRGPEGRPVEDAELRLRLEGAAPAPGAPGGGLVRTWSDGEGRYAFSFLSADTYGVSVLPPAAEDSAAGSLGRAYTGEVVVAEGETRSGVDFALEAGGFVEGRVTRPVEGAEDAPASGATIFLRDAQGILVERLSRMTTGRDGAFGCGAIGPGTYTAFARTADQVSSESAPFAVRAGETATVALVLAPGARLAVVATDAAGTELPARVVVTDEKGRRVNGLAGAGRSRFSPAETHVTAPHVLGPLAPGRYRVVVEGTSGSASESVELAAGDDRTLRLPLE